MGDYENEDGPIIKAFVVVTVYELEVHVFVDVLQFAAPKDVKVPIEILSNEYKTSLLAGYVPV